MYLWSDQDGMEAMARECESTHSNINHTLKLHNLFPENSRILIACSGGPDSMALLHLLQDIATHRHTKYKLGIAIVDHSIRPESKDEVLWLPNQVDALGSVVLYNCLDVPTLSKDPKPSEETVGRPSSLSMAK